MCLYQACDVLRKRSFVLQSKQPGQGAAAPFIGPTIGTTGLFAIRRLGPLPSPVSGSTPSGAAICGCSGLWQERFQF